MESTENRKLKAPVGSILLWIYAVPMLVAGIAVLFHLQNGTDLVLTIIISALIPVALILIGVFSLLRKNAILAGCVGVSFLLRMIVLIWNLINPQDSSVSAVLLTLQTVFLSVSDAALIFVLMTQLIPAFSPLRKAGWLKFLPPGLFLLGSAFSMANELYISFTYSHGFLAVILNTVGALIVVIIPVLAYYFIADRAMDPYSKTLKIAPPPYPPRPVYPVAGQPGSIPAQPGFTPQPGFTAPPQVPQQRFEPQASGDQLWNAPQPAPPVCEEPEPEPAPDAPSASSSANDAAAALRQYKAMLDAGLISQEDYDAKKKQVLDL